jgi:hypothetical protein
MALSIPLNRFRRVSRTLTTTPTIIYTAPFDRASILLITLATNKTIANQSVTLTLSATKPEDYTLYTQPSIQLVDSTTVGAKDSANLTIGKVVMIDGDNLIASASNNDAVDITVAILEAVNTD